MSILRPLLLQIHSRSGLTAHPYLKELKYSALAQTHSLDLIGAKAALLNVRSVRNKTFILRKFVASKDLDFLFLTETWLEPVDTCLLTELLPVNYNVLNTPRVTGRGGGVATLFKDRFKCSLVSVEKYSTFEIQLIKLELTYTVYCALI